MIGGKKSCVFKLIIKLVVYTNNDYVIRYPSLAPREKKWCNEWYYRFKNIIRFTLYYNLLYVTDRKRKEKRVNEHKELLFQKTRGRQIV